MSKYKTIIEVVQEAQEEDLLNEAIKRGIIKITPKYKGKKLSELSDSTILKLLSRHYKASYDEELIGEYDIMEQYLK